MARTAVEGAVLRHLRDRLGGVEVRARVPDPRPATLVVAWRGGGRMADPWRDLAGVHALVWAPTEAQCEALALEVSAAMRALEHLEGFALVEEESLRSDPDPETQGPRWFGSWTVTAYETF